MHRIITVENLVKSFGGINAVNGINFFVEQGKLFAFLGPNGAGKSTTIDILCTLMQPNSGRVTIDGEVLGKKDDDIRKKIGVVFQNSMLDALLTVRENLTIRSKFYDIPKDKVKQAVLSAAKTADVLEFIDRPYGKLSGGQQRRADIARALVNTPKILFLDEPTTGLDPKTKEGVWQTVSKLQKETGMTIFLTTHYMEEAATADYIILIDRGRIAAQGTPYELKEQYSSDTIHIKPKDREKMEGLLNKETFLYQEKNGIFIAKLKDTLSTIPFLVEAEPFLESFEVVHGSMDDVFLNIIGEGKEYA